MLLWGRDVAQRLVPYTTVILDRLAAGGFAELEVHKGHDVEFNWKLDVLSFIGVHFRLDVSHFHELLGQLFHDLELHHWFELWLWVAWDFIALALYRRPLHIIVRSDSAPCRHLVMRLALAQYAMWKAVTSTHHNFWMQRIIGFWVYSTTTMLLEGSTNSLAEPNNRYVTTTTTTWITIIPWGSEVYSFGLRAYWKHKED